MRADDNPIHTRDELLSMLTSKPAPRIHLTQYSSKLH